MLSAILRQEYGLSASMSQVGGENENYEVTDHTGARFFLKIVDDQCRDAIELEYCTVEAAHAACPELALPRFIKTRAGLIAATVPAKPEARLRLARLVEYVDGASWSASKSVSTEQRRDFGRQIARLALALTKFEMPTAGRTHQWDLTRAGQHRSRVGLINDHKRRRLAADAFILWSACAEPFLNDMPHSVIHDDLNDDNVRVANQRLSGLLDFGDCLYNPTICDLAIALAYLLLDEERPLEKGAEIVAGYNEVRLLSEGELELLFPLMCGRLATSVVISAGRRQIDPHREAWFVSEDRAWRALEHYIQIAPAEAARRLASGTATRIFVEGGTVREILAAKRREHFSSALRLSYDEPARFVRGRAQYLFDEFGLPYLDLYNNVCHVGHCHPRVVEAAHRQMSRLNTNTRYLYDGLCEYAERLCATLPPALRHCFFVNSGSEANELAIRLARTHTGRTDFLVVENAYHGHTNTLIDVSPYKLMGRGGAGRPAHWVHVVPIPDGYRGAYKGSERAVGVAYGDEVGHTTRLLTTPPAAFIAETLLSCGGQIIPPEGYFETAFAHVRQAGGVCILDEIQVGFGRVGTHFWAFEQQGVIPDILVLGKSIGNGHPMAAVVTTREIAESFAGTGMEFFSTFGGNPVSCAVGLAVLDVIRDEGLQAHAADIGTYFLDGLNELRNRHPIIGDVRGKGLFLGIELVRDRDTLLPATTEARLLVNALRRRRILVGTDGPFDTVIKIKPPMVVSRDDASMAIQYIDEILQSSIVPDEWR